MSWQFSDDTDRTLFLQPITKGVGAFIYTNGGEVVEVKPKEAIGIAGNLIAFSRAEAVVVEGKFPEVTIESLYKDGPLHCMWRDEQGISVLWNLDKESATNARKVGLATLAIANRIEEYLESEEHTAKVLQERRDAIAAEQGGDVKNYRHLSPWGQKAVDRIIELEDKLKESK